MCCTAMTLQANTMATTRLMRTDARRCRLGDEQKTEFRPLRMNWVVVTDANGTRQLQMSWHPNGSQ